MDEYGSVKELREHLASEQVMVVSFQDLRETLGYRKLGSRVRVEISQKLSGQGLGYCPCVMVDANNEPRAWEEVRVYLKDSPLARPCSRSWIPR